MMKRIIIVVAAMALVTSTAMAATLLRIAPLAGLEATETCGRAITPDGKYVAGINDSQGILWASDGAGGGVTSNVIASGRQSTVASGIGYRTVTAGQEVVIGGLSSGWATTYGATVSAGGVPTWNWSARDANTGTAPNLPTANSLSGTGTTDKWYLTFDHQTAATNKQFWCARGQGDPVGTMTGTYGPKSTTYESHVRGIGGGLAATPIGRMAVARRDTSNTSAMQNYYYDYAGTAAPAGTKFKGLQAGTYNGEPWAVSGDGTKLGGFAPVDGGRTGNWPYLYTVAGATIAELPTLLPNNTGAYATNGIVYGLSADGEWAAGMDYTKGIELAVLWNTVNKKEFNLNQYCIDKGILDGFTGNLRRAYAVGENALGQPVITGRGYYTADAQYRGFVLTMDIPEPATVGFLALGGLALLRRRR